MLIPFILQPTCVGLPLMIRYYIDSEAKWQALTYKQKYITSTKCNEAKI